MLTSEASAGFDQFHAGGLMATRELACRADPSEGMFVLDAGSALGGPSRFLAETYGVRVEGVDLSPQYVEVARRLAQRSGVSRLVNYGVGDISRLPFDKETFDLVWTQHVVMNIADRAGLYCELRRVVKRGGRLAFYDPLAVDGGGDLLLPVPWATQSEHTHLLTGDATRAVLERSGFTIITFDDVTAMAVEWFAQMQAAPLPPFNLSAIVGPRMREMTLNFAQNLREGRARLVMGVAEAS